MYDVIIVGAGPAGLSAAHAAQTAGLDYLVIEKGCLVNTIHQFPIGLRLYSTPELIELADVPLIVRDAKPTREDALRYYLRFTETKGLAVRTYEEVTGITGHDGDFTVTTRTKTGEARSYPTRKVILATGAYDHPNRLNVPGEDLPKVSYYFTEAHPYYGQEVLVVGGKSSAVETALTLYRSGARVTLSYRGDRFVGLKYWVQPDIENRIAEGAIRAILRSDVEEIRPAEVVLRIDGHERVTIPNDFVFCMTGYEPDVSFLRRVGVEVTEPDRRPVHDPDTFETNVRGVYVIGVITAGNISSEVFIENGRLHGPRAVQHIVRGRSA